MGAASRRKGLVGEREVAALYEAAGFAVRCLEGSGDHLVVLDVGNFTSQILHSEVKRAENFRQDWITQCEREAPTGTIPVLHWRKSRSPWRVILPLSDFVTILGAGA